MLIIFISGLFGILGCKLVAYLFHIRVKKYVYWLITLACMITTLYFEGIELLNIIGMLLFSLIYWLPIHILSKKKKDIDTVKRGSFVIEHLSENVLAYGATGSGKTKSILYPIHCHLFKKNISSLSFSAKNLEYLQHMINVYDKRWENIIISPQHYNLTDKTNILDEHILENNVLIRETFSSMMKPELSKIDEKNEYFRNGAIGLATGITIALRDIVSNTDFKISLPFFLCVCSQLTDEQAAALISKNIVATSEAKAFLTATGDTKSSISSTFANYVATLNTAGNYIAFHDNEGKYKNIKINQKGRKTNVWLINNLELDVATITTLKRIFNYINQVLLRDIEIKEKISPCQLFLDEAHTFASNLQKSLSIYRALDIYTALGTQDKSLFNSTVGTEQADALFANINQIYAGKIFHYKTAEEFSKFAGEYDETIYSRTTQDFTIMQGSNTKSQRKEKYIKPNDLMKLGKGKFLSINSTKGFEYVKLPLPKMKIASRDEILKRFKKRNETIQSIQRKHEEFLIDCKNYITTII